jgi:hypothetical protein
MIMAKYNMKRNKKTKTKAEHEYTRKRNHSNNAKIYNVDDNEQNGKKEKKRKK